MPSPRARPWLCRGLALGLLAAPTAAAGQATVVFDGSLGEAGAAPTAPLSRVRFQVPAIPRRTGRRSERGSTRCCVDRSRKLLLFLDWGGDLVFA